MQATMRGLRIFETRRSRSLRQTETDAEDKLWQRLRGRRLGGFKFVRQFPIRPFFTDFCCREEKLVVEVDGATHSTDEELMLDRRRTAAMRSAGFTVLRVTNAEVFENIDGVLETILARLERRDAL